VRACVRACVSGLLICIWGQKCRLIDTYIRCYMGQDSSVGIATRFGLDCPGNKSRWGPDFPHPSRPTLGPTQLPITEVPSFFPGGKVARAWRYPRNPSSTEVKEIILPFCALAFGAKTQIYVGGFCLEAVAFRLQLLELRARVGSP
jgi:hypothetical protein